MDGGFYFEKSRGFFCKIKKKAQSKPSARSIRWLGNVTDVATLPGQGIGRAGTPIRVIDIVVVVNGTRVEKLRMDGIRFE